MSEDIFREDDGNKNRKKSRDLQLHSIKNVMKTENGRDFMWRCLQNCCTFDDTFNADPIIHAKNAGLREHGLWLLREIKEAAHDEYLLMLKEHDHD